MGQDIWLCVLFLYAKYALSQTRLRWLRSEGMLQGDLDQPDAELPSSVALVMQGQAAGRLA